MSDIQETLSKETELLRTRVSNLYKDCQAKIAYLMETNQGSSALDIIEEQMRVLDLEVTKLENDFKFLCIKLLLNNKK